MRRKAKSIMDTIFCHHSLLVTLPHSMCCADFPLNSISSPFPASFPPNPSPPLIFHNSLWLNAGANWLHHSTVMFNLTENVFKEYKSRITEHDN